MADLKLNVGSGADVRKGWVNLDSHKKFGAQIKFDLEDVFKGSKLPFKDDTFDVVVCNHVLEDFINPIPIMRELVRVCKKRGRIEIRVPFHARLYINNLYHKRAFTIGTLRGFTKPTYGVDEGVTVLSHRYTNPATGGFGRLHASLCCFIANLVGWEVYESTGLQYLFPTVDIEIIYEVR